MNEFHGYPTVSVDSPAGAEVTHVMVPVDEFRRLKECDQREKLGPPPATAVEEAIRVMHSERHWTDAEETIVELIRDGIESVRRSRGVTQDMLGCLVGLSQSQVSRLERSPERATVEMLRRIADVFASQQDTGRT